LALDLSFIQANRVFAAANVRKDVASLQQQSDDKMVACICIFFS